MLEVKPHYTPKAVTAFFSESQMIGMSTTDYGDFLTKNQPVPYPNTTNRNDVVPSIKGSKPGGQKPLEILITYPIDEEIITPIQH